MIFYPILMQNKNTKKSSPFILLLRKWSRILHRDIGFFFVGASIIYGISGIALNHINDWNPNYSVSIEKYKTSSYFKEGASKKDIAHWVSEQEIAGKYKTHYYPQKNLVKIYLTNNTTLFLDLNNGNIVMEKLKRRPIFYESNLLHYNPNRWWTWFSDAFAISLILFAITGILMIKGKKGIAGRGGIYIALGILIPIIIFLIS